MEELRICSICHFRTAALERTICNTCKSAANRKKYPVRKVFLDLRASAKKRGIKFDMRYEDFSLMVSKTDYMARRGRKDDDLNIDRIDEDGGYTIDNIQVLTKRENVQKFHEYNKNKNKPKEEILPF